MNAIGCPLVSRCGQRGFPTNWLHWLSTAKWPRILQLSVHISRAVSAFKLPASVYEAFSSDSSEVSWSESDTLASVPSSDVCMSGNFMLCMCVWVWSGSGNPGGCSFYALHHGSVLASTENLFFFVLRFVLCVSLCHSDTAPVGSAFQWSDMLFLLFVAMFSLLVDRWLFLM